MVASLALTCAWVEIPASSFNRAADAGFGVIEPTPPPALLPLDSQPKPTIETAASSEPFSQEPEASPAAPTAAVSRGFTFDWQRYAPYAVGLYLLGVAAVFSRFLIGYGGGQRLRRRSQPVEDPTILSALARQARKVGLAVTPAIAYCSRIAVPTVVGVLRPTILLPFSFATGLTPEQVELLLCHELAHIRRFDPLFNVLQRVIEAILFFHPAVWFISHRVRVERENCCDDIVLATGGDSAEYASSLVEIARRGLSSSAPVEGLTATGRPSQLRMRILRMLGNCDHEQMRLRQVWIPAVVTLALVGALVSRASEDIQHSGSGFITGTVEAKESGEALGSAVTQGASTPMRDRRQAENGFSAKVLDASGNPVADASVHLLRPDERLQIRNGSPEKRNRPSSSPPTRRAGSIWPAGENTMSSPSFTTKVLLLSRAHR
jgi:beta-lactamase regulating signal transducer with metallopeptidase domain